MSLVHTIIDPHADPLERGPPKRISYNEQDIGERVKMSKKRVQWDFALGDSQRVHQLVLTHSVVSLKKVVELDGRVEHFSEKLATGDWSFQIYLQASNHMLEVHIREKETDTLPKYDLTVHGIPFIRWDLWRRPHVPMRDPHSYNAPSNSSQPSVGFATHKWGASGASGSSTVAAPDTVAMTHDEPQSASYQSRKSAERQQRLSNRKSSSEKKPAVGEVNLMGDFEVSPSSAKNEVRSSSTSIQSALEGLSFDTPGSVERPKSCPSSHPAPVSFSAVRPPPIPQVAVPQSGSPGVDPWRSQGINPIQSMTSVRPAIHVSSATVGYASSQIYGKPATSQPYNLIQPNLPRAQPFTTAPSQAATANYSSMKAPTFQRDPSMDISSLLDPNSVTKHQNPKDNRKANIDVNAFQGFQ